MAVIKEEEAEKENGILMEVVGGACGKQTAGSLLHVRMLSSEGSTGGSIVSVPIQCVDCVCMQAVSPTRTKGYSLQGFSDVWNLTVMGTSQVLQHPSDFSSSFFKKGVSHILLVFMHIA